MTRGDRRARMLLRLLLNVTGLWLALSSRVSSRFRSQVTRAATIELASDDGVTRRFVFDGATRRVALRGGSARDTPHCALRFRSARLALAVLGSKDGPRMMLDGLGEGTIRFEGSPALFGWFQGLLGAALPSRSNRRPLPHAYRGPDRSARHASLITIEPSVAALDPSWTGAVRAREQLANWRAAGGARSARG
jgi:hypothetical protein